MPVCFFFVNTEMNFTFSIKGGEFLEELNARKLLFTKECVPGNV
jgi:hypothetical protein